METEGRNKQRIFHKILTYGAALILCSVVALIVLQLIGSSTGRDVSNENIVLTFIGILATFIVVGNFSQVKEVEDRIRKDFDDFKRIVEKDADKEYKRFSHDLTEMKDKLTDDLTKSKESMRGEIKEADKHLLEKADRESTSLQKKVDDFKSQLKEDSAKTIEDFRKEYEGFKDIVQKENTQRIDDFKKSIRLTLHLRTKTFEQQISVLRTQMATCEEQYKNIPNKIRIATDDSNTLLSQRLFDIFKYIIETQEQQSISAFIFKLLNNSEIDCIVHLQGEPEKQIYNVKAKMNTSRKVEFYKINEQGQIESSPIENVVDRVDGVAYDGNKVERILVIFDTLMPFDETFAGGNDFGGGPTGGGDSDYRRRE